MTIRPWTFRLSLAATVAALCVAVACGGGSGAAPTPSLSPSPTPTQLILTPGPTESPPQTAYQLLVRSTSATQDIIWRASPADLTQRIPVAAIDHREGFPVKAAISPDGTFLAVLSLPDEATSADSSQAVASVIDLKTNETTELTGGVDYQYTPLWSPDSALLYMRRYAGPEFLAANVSVLRVRVVHKPGPDDPTPKPTPTVPPGIEPWPGVDAVETILQDSVAHVLRFSPIGFADDGNSMFFLEEEGGTEGTSVIGIYSPAATAEVDKRNKAAEDAWYAAQQANLQALQAAQANGQPPPADTVTPAPTPAPDSRLVVVLSDQSVSGCSLSPDAHSVAYLAPSFTESGDILTQTYVANLIEATAAPLPLRGLSVGDQLDPAWYPDGRLTVGVLPDTGGPGQLALLALDLSSITLLAQPESGFDVPRAWAPDGTWLAVTHMSGTSQANPGDSRLDIVSVNGHRITVIDGPDMASKDAVLGWVKP